MIWVALAVTVFLSLVLTGIIRRYSLARNLVDIPNQRSSHSVATPHGGGVAIVVSFLLMASTLEFYGLTTNADILMLLAAGGWIAVIGLLDDIRHIPARWRLLGHFIGAAGALIWLDGLPPVLLFGHSYDLGWLGSIGAVIFLVWLLNLYNFMDGIDGIAGIEAITVSLGGIVLYCLAQAPGELWIAPALLIAATSGFLFWNFPRARIFMGDSGSGFLGLTLGLFAVQAAGFAAELMWSWMILLGVFVVDATVTLIRRILRSERFYEAHRSHAYQYAARRFASHTRISIACAAINLFWLLPIASIVALGWLDGLIALVVAYLPLIFVAVVFKAGARDLQQDWA